MGSNSRYWIAGAGYILVAIVVVIASYLLFDQLPAVSSFLPGSFSKLP